jgi:hypothetical protein|tara:strand:+ start:352 stop:867 length:516 start_codon:yes stop_codon:yes gene_type:complete
MPIQRAKPRLVDLDQTPLTSVASSDLPAGSILKFQKVTWTTQTQVTAQTFTDVTGGTFSFTPVSASSTLRITSLLHIYLGKGGSTEVGGSFQVVHNGSALEAPGTEQYRKVAGSGTAIFQLPHNFSNYVASGNTNARTIKVQGKALLGSSEFLVNKGGSYTSHIEVLEIAG